MCVHEFQASCAKSIISTEEAKYKDWIKEV